MLCDQCHQREATVFLTQIINGQMSKSQLCSVCGAEIVTRAKTAPGFGEAFSPDALKKAAEALSGLFSGVPALADLPYEPPAFAFVLRAVVHASQKAPGQEHLPARAVADAFRELALAEFGLQALPTLAGWGVHSCDDLGAIVFALVATRQLGSQPGERPEDFFGLYDFATAFPTSA